MLSRFLKTIVSPSAVVVSLMSLYIVTSCSTAKHTSDRGMKFCVEDMAGEYVDISRNGLYELKIYPDSTFGYRSHIGELGGDECVGMWKISRDTINFYILPDTFSYRVLVAIKYLDTLPPAKIISKDRLKINFSPKTPGCFNSGRNQPIRPDVYNDSILILNRKP